jgi:lambda family phage portal protein
LLNGLKNKASRGFRRLADALGSEKSAPEKRRSSEAGWKHFGMWGGFEAARRDRVNSDWPTDARHIDGDLRQDLRVLRDRSRLLCRNDPYAKRFTRLLCQNVIGQKGIAFQSKFKRQNSLDSELNALIERDWKIWGRKEYASVSQKSSWIDLLELCLKRLICDGEAIFQKVATKSDFGFRLRPIDASFLDENHNTTLPNGNRVLMGVEVNDDEKPINYHLRPPGQDRFDRRLASASRIVIPADQIIHVYFEDEVDQTRGVPLLVSAMKMLRQMGRYRDAEVIAAWLGACKVGFYHTPANVEEPLTKPSQANGTEYEEEDESFPLTLEPGSFFKLPAGYQVESYDPQHPNTGFKDFDKAILHGICAGLGPSYVAVTGDLSQASFSSLRFGTIQDNDFYRGIQRFLIEHFCDPVSDAWHDAQILAGRYPIEILGKNQIGIDREWRPRGFSGVNPLQDIQAQKVAIELGVTTLTDEIANAGGDIEETLATLKAENELFDQYGIKRAVVEDALTNSNPDAEE